MNIVIKTVTEKKPYPKRKSWGIEYKRYSFNKETREQSWWYKTPWIHHKSYKTKEDAKQALRHLRTNIYSYWKYNGKIHLIRYRLCRVVYV